MNGGGEDEMSARWRLDMKIDSTIADVLPKLEWLKDQAGGRRVLGGKLALVLDALADERAMIARRWD